MIKQNPFSVYDFLGYLIPGSLFIYVFLSINYLKKQSDFKFEEFLRNFTTVKFEEIFFFVVLSYTIGHLLSFTSSITVEKYANWRYSYPSKYLLKIDYKGYFKSCDNWKDWLWRIIMILVLFPCTSFDLVFGKIFGFKRFYQKPLDVFLIDIIKLKINKLLSKIGVGELTNKEDYTQGKGRKYDFHRIITHYAYENSQSHRAKMSNYVALYGFLRTLCLIFNFLTIYLFLRIIFFLNFNFLNILALLVLSCITYLAFMAFMKFYRRYTLEGFMIIVIDEKLIKK